MKENELNAIEVLLELKSLAEQDLKEANALLSANAQPMDELLNARNDAQKHIDVFDYSINCIKFMRESISKLKTYEPLKQEVFKIPKKEKKRIKNDTLFCPKCHKWLKRDIVKVNNNWQERRYCDCGYDNMKHTVYTSASTIIEENIKNG